jgi:hypothetical protein
VGVKLGLSHEGKNIALRVCENWTLKKIFGPYSEEVIGGCRKVHNEELYDWIPQQIFLA